MSGPHIQAGDTLVTLQDLRATRYCLAGARLFCRQHGLDWAGFLAHGVSAQALRATGDAQVEAVIATAMARAARASEHYPPA